MPRRWGYVVAGIAVGCSAAAAQVPRTPPIDTFAPIQSTARAEFVNFESGPVTPMLLLADGRLAVLNTPDARVELFTPGPGASLHPSASIFTGLDPVAMVQHPTDPRRLFVSNHVSDTVSVVDLVLGQVVATIPVGDEPQGLVVEQGRLFVACSRASAAPLAPGAVDPNPIEDHTVVVRSAEAPYDWVANVPIQGGKVRDLVVADGKVWVIPQNSGNRTTLLNETAADALGLTQLEPDRFQQRIDVNPILTKPQLNNGAVARGWRIPFAGRIVFDWEYPGETVQLPDADVTGIDPLSLALLPSPTRNVGTTLFDVERNPSTGDLWVLNTEALNRFRFEPRHNGQAMENRITVVVPGGDPVDLIKLHTPDFPRNYTQPVDVAFGTDTIPRAFVACLGSSAVVVLDPVTGNFVEEIATPGMPLGVEVDEANDLLYVYTWEDHAVRSYDISGLVSVPVGGVRRLPYDPEPPIVRQGRRHLYSADAAEGHGNGTMSCASCHVFGHHDASAWDLGDAEGSLAYYYPEIMVGQNGFDGDSVVDFFTPIVHPLKGPMVTQSLRGLLDGPEGKDDRPLHWRGDRVLFQMFRPAFHGLLGGEGIDARQTQEFAAYLRSMKYAPNPYQRKDRSYAGAEDVGRDKFGMNPQFQGLEYIADTGLSCIVCHHGNFFDGSDYTGSRQTVSHGAFSQIFNTSQLRMIYEKDHLDLLGFGAIHDGAFDGVRGFLGEHKPRDTALIFSAFTDTDRDQVAAFVEQWDHGQGPMVGAQFTVDDSNDLEAYAFLSLAQPAAEAGVPHCDLILKGYRIAGGQVLPRGAVYEFDPGQNQWLWRFDTGDLVSTDTVILVAKAGLARWTFSCVPHGLGERLGVDRDEDGLMDEQERLRGSDGGHPDSDRDGVSDGDEVARGTDPLSANAPGPDARAPSFLEAFVAEVGPDTASFGAVLDEASTLKLRLGTTAGGGDLGRLRSDGKRCRHDLILTGLPADSTVHWTAVATDSAGNLRRQRGSFQTFVPLFHVEEIELEVSGSGPYQATARVRVLDHAGQAVVGVPLTGYWDGEIGPQSWIQSATTGADGWAEFPLSSFDPGGPTTLAFSPAFIGSDDPQDPWYCGDGGDRPKHFYDQAANKAHYVMQEL